VVRLFAPTLFLVLAHIGSVCAGPREDLLRSVPDDYTFCLVLQNLRDHAKQEASPAFKAILNSPLLQLLKNAPEAQQAKQTVDTILKELDVTVEQLVNDILGDAVVIAYRKGPAAHPEQEDGLIMLHARDPKLLAKLVERLNEFQTKSGEVKKIEAVDAKGIAYTRRTKNNNAPTDAYLLDGNELIFATREEGLKPILASRTIARSKNPTPAIIKRLTELGLNDAVLACLVNPRSFDADIQAGADSGKGDEQVFLKEFSKYWKALDHVALFARTTPTVELGVALQVRTQALPAHAKTFFSEASKLSPLWKSVPDDAMFAAVGRFHLESFVGMFKMFLADDDRQKIHAGVADAARAFWEGDDLSGLLKGFGPDIGLCIAPPNPADKTWFPQAFLAVKTADGPEGKAAEEAALTGLDFLARTACLADKELRLHKEVQGGITVKSLAHASKFPPGFRPAFAAKNGYLIVASSAATISRFDPPRTAATSADEVPLVRLSATAWRNYLKTHRDDVTKYLATLNGKDVTEISAQLDGLLTITDGFDKIELLQRSGPDRATLFLRVTGVKK
jgi:hypothetical protein